MFIQFFKSNRPIVFLALLVVVIALWSFAFFNGNEVDMSNSSMPLYELLILCTGNFKVIKILIAVMLVVIQAKLINDLSENYEILNKGSFLPALFYIVLMSSYPALLSLHPVLLANLFLLLALKQLLSIYHKEDILIEIFDSGLLIAVASLFYFSAIIFFFIIYVVLAIFRPFNWREWFIPFIGIIVPYLFVGTFYFWYDQLYDLWHEKIVLPIVSRTFMFSIDTPLSILITILIIVSFFSLKFLLSGLNVNTVRSKKNILIMIWFFILSLLSLVMAISYRSNYFAFLSIPLSIYFANYFLMAKKRWWIETLFVLLIGAIVFNQVISL